MFLRIVILILVMGSITGCYKDYDNSNSDEFPAPPQTIINTRMSGAVITPNGQHLAGYTVEWQGGSQAVQGKYFLAYLEQARKLDQSIWIEKDGEIISVGQWPLVENDINSISMQAFSSPKQESLGNGLALSSALSISDVEGSGSLTYRKIVTEGQLNHVRSETGELLALDDVEIYNIQLSQGATAQLQVQESKRVFKYDQDESIWIELSESKRTIADAGYFVVGNAVAGIVASGKVSQQNTPVSYQWYELDDDRLGRSTAKGNWIQVLPANSDVVVDILNPCFEEVNTQKIITTAAALTKDLEVGPLTLLQPIETQVIDCDGHLVTETAIQISNADNESVLYFYGASEINTIVPLCDDQFSLAAYDTESDEAGLAIPWGVGIEDEVTYLTTCPDFQDGYSFYQIREDIKMYQTFTYANDGDKITLSSTDGNIRFVINGVDKGKYDVDEINVKVYDPGFGPQGYAVSCESSDFGCGITDCFVSHIGEEDDWVRVTFAGNIWMQTISPLTAGTYPVEGIILCKAQ